MRVRLACFLVGAAAGAAGVFLVAHPRRSPQNSPQRQNAPACDLAGQWYIEWNLAANRYYEGPPTYAIPGVLDFTYDPSRPLTRVGVGMSPWGRKVPIHAQIAPASDRCALVLAFEEIWSPSDDVPVTVEQLSLIAQPEGLVTGVLHIDDRAPYGLGARRWIVKGTARSSLRIPAAQ